jgi:hypothetical protein
MEMKADQKKEIIESYKVLKNLASEAKPIINKINDSLKNGGTISEREETVLKKFIRIVKLLKEFRKMGLISEEDLAV